MEPAVSVLLPVYNAEQTLRTCLRSLVRQSLSNWQCVLVDDGSRDESCRIAREFARIEPRVRIVETDHCGIVGALQRGLEQCTAPYVARMDADDWMHRDRLKAQIEVLEARAELCAVGSRVRIFPRASEVSTGERSLPGESERVRTGRLGYETWLNRIQSPEDVAREAWVECPIAHPTLCVRREVLERFSYRDCGWPEDYDLVLRMLGAGEKIAVVR